MLHEDLKQFECGIPWMNGSPPTDLPHNRYIVLNMFKSTMRKLDKDPIKRTQYKEVHLSEVASNFIEPVPISELEDPNVKIHFLHHFPVQIAQRLVGEFLMSLSELKEMCP